MVSVISKNPGNGKDIYLNQKSLVGANLNDLEDFSYNFSSEK